MLHGVVCVVRYFALSSWHVKDARELRGIVRV